MQTLYKRSVYIRSVALSTITLFALLLALAALAPLAASADQGTTDPPPAVPGETPVLAPTVVLTPTEGLELFAEDLGPAGAPLDATEPLTDSILPALSDYLVRDKSAGTAEDLANAFGDTVPARPLAVGPRVFLPMVGRAPAQAGPTPVTPTPVTPTPPAKGADITVVAWADPSLRVARGGTLAYELRVYNDGEGGAKSARVTLPFDPALMTLVGSRLDRGAGDWVSEVRSNAVVVTFGRLGDEEMRSGFVYFRVGSFLADNTVLSTRPAYSWSDDRGTHERSGPWAPVLVGGGNDSAAYVWTIVQPVTGLPSELRTFYSNRFAPGETVTTWLNAPRGVVSLDLRETVDEQGQVWLEYRPSLLAPGSYQMVVYGNKSRLAGVVTFVVR